MLPRGSEAGAGASVAIAALSRCMRCCSSSGNCPIVTSFPATSARRFHRLVPFCRGLSMSRYLSRVACRLRSLARGYQVPPGAPGAAGPGRRARRGAAVPLRPPGMSPNMPVESAAIPGVADAPAPGHRPRVCPVLSGAARAAMRISA
ncbi:hypothetical protein ACU4GD_40625 [Cupriavidus basilensis]